MAKKTSQEMSKDQLAQLRQALGVGDDVTDADLQTLASSPVGQAILSKIEKQSKGGGLGMFGNWGEGTIGKFIEGALGGEKSLGEWFARQKGTKNLEKLWDKLGGPTAKDAPSKKPPPGKTTTTSSAPSAEQVASDIASNAMLTAEEGFGQGQANQNAAITDVVGHYLGGGGFSSGSPAVDAAQAAYQQAYSAGEGLQSAAYQNMGTANANYLQSAPLAPVANLLTQSFGSGQFKELPQSTVQSLPVAAQYALQQMGVGEAPSTGGSPSYGQQIPTPKGGWPASLTAGTTAPANAASTLNLAQLLGGSNPTTNAIASGTLNPGIPSQTTS